MSKRNSRAAKAARRTAEAARYPRMPESACFGSSRILAACYPELRYAEGWRSVSTYADGREIPDGPVPAEHAWNVVIATGEIIDSTVNPGLTAAVNRGQARTWYREEPLQRPAGSPELRIQVIDAAAAVAAAVTAGMSPGSKRKALEAFSRGLGELIALQPAWAERCSGRWGSDGMSDGDLVPVYLTVAVRTSGGNGPGVVRVPPDEAGRIIARRHGVHGELPPRGFEDGGADARTIATAGLHAVTAPQATAGGI